MRTRRRTAFIITTLLVLLALILLQVWYVALQIYPEMAMAINSQCRVVSPNYGWNGKVMGWQVGQNSLLNRPPEHNIHHRREAIGDRRKLVQGGSGEQAAEAKAGEQDGQDYLSKKKKGSHRLIVWGTHHRTGTYFAQKMFATVCAHYNWCCVFHPTRDSVEAIKHMLSLDDVFIMGHNQWIWNPAELLGKQVEYKFVHFYRNPVEKIISGYHYHRSGIEPWTMKTLHFPRLCDNVLYAAAAGAGVSNQLQPRSRISREDVVDYCHSVQLCETCCRKEHETVHSPQSQSVTPTHAEYRSRATSEYAYICKHLGKVQGSLQDALLSASAEEGLAIEASIDYYESALMVRLVQETWTDPHALHIDLDSLKADFEVQLRRIVRHIQVASTAEEEAVLLEKLRFLDVSKSTIYSWVLSNWLHKHILSSPTAIAEAVVYREQLLKNKEFMELYGSMLQVLEQVQHTPASN